MKDYQRLLDYYKDCFALVDSIHFNSEVTHDTYCQAITPNDSETIPITHSGINDCRKKKVFDDKKLRLGFIGSTAPYKGFPVLKESLRQLGNMDAWRLDVWGGAKGEDADLPIYYRGKFDHSAIETVYTTMDVMVVPSQWHETFSLVTLEALSYGVPIIVSDNVGAKDIVREYAPNFIFHSQEELTRLLEELLKDRSMLRAYNRAIVEKEWRHSLNEHAREIMERLYLQEPHY